MSNQRSKGIVGIFILITFLFLIFLVFAFYTISNLKSTSKIGGALSSENAAIAVIEIEGVIMESRKTVEKLIKAEEDETVKAIILRINSPGGAVGPTQEIYEEIRRIDKDKPIYASFGAVAASGGYYIGAACRKIYANAGALTGSIGVIMNFMNMSKLYEFAKVTANPIKAGKYKDIGSPARKMTSEEELLLTDMIDNVHEQFIMDIYKVREKKILKGLDGLREYAQGQIFSGEGAKERGLVDELGGLWVAGRAIHKELKLEGKFALRYIKNKKKNSITEILRGLEESIQDFTYGVKGYSVPMLMFK